MINSVRVNLKGVSPEDIDLITAAAQVSGKTTGAFIAAAAKEQALRAIGSALDTRVISLSDAALGRIFQPRTPNDALRRLIATSPPWQKTL